MDQWMSGYRAGHEPAHGAHGHIRDFWIEGEIWFLLGLGPWQASVLSGSDALPVVDVLPVEGHESLCR